MSSESDEGTANKPGYGKPPKDTQFRKGKSGNPRGRPKGISNFTSDLRDELLERIDVREGQSKKRITKQRAMIKSQVNKSIQGDTRAAQLMFGLSEKHLDVSPDSNEPLNPEERAVFDASEKRHLRRQQMQSASQPDPSAQEISSEGSPIANDSQGDAPGVPIVLRLDHRSDGANAAANSPEASEGNQQIDESKP